MIELRVECTAGYQGEEAPRFFHIGESRFEVKHLLERWLGPDHRYFKVTCTRDHLYILRREIQSGQWELTFFEQNPSEEDRMIIK